MTRVPCDLCQTMVPHQNLSQHHAGHKCRVAMLRRRAVEEGWTAPTLAAGRGSLQRFLHNRRGLLGGLGDLAIYSSHGVLRTPAWVSAAADAYALASKVTRDLERLTTTPGQDAQRDGELQVLLQRLADGSESERQRLVVLALGGPASTLAYLQTTELLTDLRRAG